MNDQIRRIKRAIAKNERRIKAGKPLPKGHVEWAVKRDLLVQALAKLEGGRNVEHHETSEGR